MAKSEWRSALLAVRRDPTLPCGWEPNGLGAWSWLFEGRCVGDVGGPGRAAWLCGFVADGRGGGADYVQPLPGMRYGETLGWQVCKLGMTVDPESTALDPRRSKQWVCVTMVLNAWTCLRASYDGCSFPCCQVLSSFAPCVSR